VKAVVFLQNAWSAYYAGRTWQRDRWLAALDESRSGQRLRVLTTECPKVEIWFDNTTPIVGEKPSSVVTADLAHMRAVVEEQKPDVIVACGLKAHSAISFLAATAIPSLKLQDIPTLMIPHPACRVLQNDLYRYAGRLLADGFTGRVRLDQERGGFTRVNIALD
jgi:hypothetical protein